MRRFSVSVLIVLCLVSRVSTQGKEQSMEISRILYKQTSHLPKVQEVIPNGEVPGEEAPASKERDLGQSQPSSSDTSSGRKLRRIRESSEPPRSKDRTRWFLLISPLLVTLLGVIFCAVGKNVLWKPTRNVRKMIPNAEDLDLFLQPSPSLGSCGSYDSYGFPKEEELRCFLKSLKRASGPSQTTRTSSTKQRITTRISCVVSRPCDNEALEMLLKSSFKEEKCLSEDTSGSRTQFVSNKKYRVEVQSMFHCQETGIKFEVQFTTIIEYSLEYGDDYMKLIQENRYELLGPIFNVEVISGRVSVVYLPHYVRLEGFGGDKSKIKCGRFKDGKFTLSIPSRVEASYVVLENPTFSRVAAVGGCFTFMRRRRKSYPIGGKVLIYFRVVCVEDEDFMEYRVHLYFLPADRPHLEKLNDLKRLEGFKRVDKPPLTSDVFTKTNYIISGKPDPTINPKTLKFFVHKEIENLPFTEINFPKKVEKISLRVEAEKSPEIGPVWSGELTRADIKELSRQVVQKGIPFEHFVDRHRSALIQKVKNIPPVLDDLMRRKLLTEEESSTIRSQPTPQETMRKLLQYVETWGREDKDTFYRVLKDHNKPCIREIEK